MSRVRAPSLTLRGKALVSWLTRAFLIRACAVRTLLLVGRDVLPYAPLAEGLDDLASTGPQAVLAFGSATADELGRLFPGEGMAAVE